MNKKHSISIIFVTAALLLIAWSYLRPNVGGLNPARPVSGGGGVALGTVTPLFKDQTFQTAAGAQMATGSIRLVGDASALSSSDLIYIGDGTNTTTITFNNMGGGNTSYSAGTLTIDNGGGMSKDQLMSELYWGWLLTMQSSGSKIKPHCDNFGSLGAGFSPATRCISFLDDGTPTTTKVFFINTQGGTAGNKTIFTTSTNFSVEGMQGGAAS